jgi:hypothetical protein
MAHIRVVKIWMCPASHEAIELIKSTIHRMVLFGEAKMPLAESARDVTGWLKPFGKEDFIKWNA